MTAAATTAAGPVVHADVTTVIRALTTARSRQGPPDYRLACGASGGCAFGRPAGTD